MEFPIIKCSNWNLTKRKQKDFVYVSNQYLHGQAQDICNFDCIEANILFTKEILNLHLFHAKLLLKDKRTLDVIVIPYIDFNKVSSLICLCDDEEGMTDAFFRYKPNKKINLLMNNVDEKYLFNNYPIFKQIYKKYIQKL